MPMHFLEATAGSVFHASWQAGVLAIVVFAIGRAASRLPAAVRCWLWLIVLIRFLAPAVPQSAASLFNVTQISMSGGAPTADVSGPRPAPRAPTPIEPVATLVPAQDAVVLAEPHGTTRAVSIAVVGWLLGFLIVSSRNILSLFCLRQLLAGCRAARDKEALALLEACRVEVGIRRRVSLVVTDFDTAPALAGVFSPRIVISKKTLESLERDELRWLFRHELVHVRRADLLVQRLWELACAVHWFNPLAWWGASRGRLAAELACDESLLRRTASAEHVKYGQALLRVADSLTIAARVPGAVGLLVREPALTGRIRAIAGYRGRSRLWTIGGSMLLIALALAGLTDALENRGDAQQPSSPSISKASPPSPRSSAATASNPKRKVKIDPKELATTKGKMRILVLQLDGRPVEGAEVFANVMHPGEARWLITNRTYFTNAGGIAILELPPKVGVTKIWASKRGKPGYPDLFACWFPGIDSDASVLPEEFTFQPPLCVLGGVVVDEDGKPIGGVTIDAKISLVDAFEVGKPGLRPVFDHDSYWTSSNPGPPSAAITNGKGRWVMDNVPSAARVGLKLSCPGYVSEEIWDGVQPQEGFARAMEREVKAGSDARREADRTHRSTLTPLEKLNERPASPLSEQQRPAPSRMGPMNAPIVLSLNEKIFMQAVRRQTARFVMRRIK